MIVKFHAIVSWTLTRLDAASQPCWETGGFFRRKLWKGLIRGAKVLPCAIIMIACAVTRLTPAAWFLWQPEVPRSRPAHGHGSSLTGLAPSLWRSSCEWICSNPREASPRLHSHHFLYLGIPPAEGGCWTSMLNVGGGWRTGLQTSQWRE